MISSSLHKQLENTVYVFDVYKQTILLLCIYVFFILYVPINETSLIPIHLVQQTVKLLISVFC